MKKGRSYLIKLFSRGSLPTEDNFKDLINSSFNLQDDGFDALFDGPLELFVKEDEKTKKENHSLLEFYPSIRDTESKPSWKFSIGYDRKSLQISNEKERVVVVIDQEGKVRFNTQSINLGKVIRRQSTIGTYRSPHDKNRSANFPREVRADGNWKTIIERMEGCQLFEVAAGVEYSDTKSYAILLANASLVPSKYNWPFFTPRNTKIHITQSYSGLSNNKLDLKWAKNAEYKGSYNLLIRSRRDYGGTTMIKYHITQKWFDKYKSFK
ncbi:MAG: hypothetical protein AAF600_06670 [Bacteroidota bacterium]